MSMDTLALRLCCFCLYVFKILVNTVCYFTESVGSISVVGFLWMHFGEYEAILAMEEIGWKYYNLLLCLILLCLVC